MRGMPFNLQGQGVLEVATEISSATAKWKENTCRSIEPTSVLDKRSPSPSTSTLSSSLGGGGGSTDSAGVAAVSDNPPQKWPLTQQQEDNASAAGETAGVGRKDEWASDLHPITASLEISGAEKCGTSLGMEDWENIMSDSGSSPTHEQSFFRWFMNDMDDPSPGLKQLLQGAGGGASEFEGGAGFGIVDPGFGYESVAGVSTTSLNAAINTPLPATTGSVEFTAPNRVLSVPNPSSGLPNFRAPCFGNNVPNNPPNPIVSANNNLLLPLPLSLPPSAFYQQNNNQLEPSEEKPQIFNPMLSQQQSHPAQTPSSFFLPLSYGQQEQHLGLPPQAKRHQHSIMDPAYQIPKVTFSDSGQDIPLRRQQQPQQQQQANFSQSQQLLPLQLHQRAPTTTKPKMGGSIEGAQQQQQAMVDQLFKAAELVETGNSIHARGILARLNHQLPLGGKPLQRAAFYFKEALQLLLNNNSPLPRRNSPNYPLDVVYKIGAYKVFSEISPSLQFANFTSNQALLESLDGFDRIHIVDFDIGLGGQWASFMQELSMKLGGAPSLKITAFTSSSHDPLELGLTRENLAHFASNLNVSFEFNVVSLDSFDPNSALSVPTSAMLNLSENEAIAVNIPVGPSSPSVPSLLRLVKQLSPKIVISMDRGCDRSDLPFSHHFLHALQSYTVLIDSIDAVNLNSDAVHKIERYLLRPRIESVIVGRHRAAEKMLPWRALFASAGFTPLPFSNFTETQAEYLIKRLQVRGFHVEKRQASLNLFWQHGELVSVSAWRC